MTDSDDGFDAEFDAEFGCGDELPSRAVDGARGSAGPADYLSSHPKEVLLRILAFLPASDLSAIASVCNLLRGLSNEDVLWRRLFCARWGKPSDAIGGNVVWKTKYVDADTEECHKTVDGAAEELRAVFIDMQKAKRQTCLGRALVDDTAELPKCQVQRQLTEWRWQRGFADVANIQRPDLSKASLRFHRIGPDTFVCEDTGWAHLCDHSCREGFVDSDSGLITCVVSGRTSASLMSRHEELRLQQCSVDACFAAADQELNSFSAARAYTEGYYGDERELRLRYGVELW